MAEEKKRTGRLLWMLVFGIPLVVCLGLFGLIWKISSSLGELDTWTADATTEEADPGSWLEWRVAGGFVEAPVDPMFAEFGGDNTSQVWKLTETLRQAATDENIAGLYLQIDHVGTSFGQLQELGDAIDAFRDAGKPVHAFLRGDMISDGSYLLAASADQIWTTPEAMFLIDGLMADVTFWKGTLDKLHIEPDVIMFREYKSAGEPMSRYAMSEPFREALVAVLDDIQRQMEERIAARRELTADAVDALIDRAAMGAREALDARLIDRTGYLDQVRASLAEIAETEEYESISMNKYRVDAPGDGPRLALIVGEGPIAATGDGGLFGDDGTIVGTKLARTFREAIDDDDVRGIVFRVNSPGGSAVGSDLVRREIERAKEAGKPVVVSMAGVAGSGGYWISMAADAIFAQPSTITGSIGVVFQKLNTRGFWEWMGAHIDSVQFADNANILSPYASLSEAQRATLEALIGQMYDSFVDHVAGYRSLERQVAEGLARGRIWSGEDALEHGLIDGLGGMDAAITRARELVGDADMPVGSYPEPKTFLERFLEEELDLASMRMGSADLRDVVEQAAMPRVLTQMPDVRVH